MIFWMDGVGLTPMSLMFFKLLQPAAFPGQMAKHRWRILF
jgi:hypothetical protein